MDLIFDCDWMRSIDPDPDIFIILQQMCLQKCNLKNHHIPKNERGSNFVINHWSKVTPTIFCTYQLRCKSSVFFATILSCQFPNFSMTNHHENILIFFLGLDFGNFLLNLIPFFRLWTTKILASSTWSGDLPKNHFQFSHSFTPRPIWVSNWIGYSLQNWSKWTFK